MEKEIVGLKAEIDKLMKQNDALKAKLFNVMRGIILFKTVRAFGFKIEPSLITCCYNFVKIFILKKNLCFPQVGWNACAVFVGDFFTRIYNVLVHFSLCKQWHFLKRSTPVFFRIFYRSNLRLAGKVTSSRLGQRKFSSPVQLIWIGIHDLFIFTILDELFDSVKKYWTVLIKLISTTLKSEARTWYSGGRHTISLIELFVYLTYSRVLLLF